MVEPPVSTRLSDASTAVPLLHADAGDLARGCSTTSSAPTPVASCSSPSTAGTVGSRAGRERCACRGEPTAADVAVTVGDPFQRRGLGTRLLRELAHAARAQGIERFTGHVLVDNAAARGLLIGAGATLSFSEPGVFAFDIPLGRRVGLAS